MSSFKPTNLWEASPHTLAKLEIVGRYLDVWFLILGSNPKNRRLVYIDGFAGPGRYTNTEKSSPIVALQSGLNGCSVRWLVSGGLTTIFGIMLLTKLRSSNQN